MYFSFQYFAIQFYGECWSGKDAGTTFANAGPASETKCKDGVGTSWVNAVYKIVNLPGIILNIPTLFISLSVCPSVCLSVCPGLSVLVYLSWSVFRSSFVLSVFLSLTFLLLCLLFLSVLPSVFYYLSYVRLRICPSISLPSVLCFCPSITPIISMYVGQFACQIASQ